MRRKKKKEFPQLPATELKDNYATQSLKALSDEALQAEFLTATNAEAWLRSTAVAFTESGGPPDLAAITERGAAYARIARELIATILVTRWEEKEDGESKPKGYL